MSNRVGWRFIPVAGVALGLLTLTVVTHASFDKFERTYSPRGVAHLTISNVNGDITVSGWEKNSINVRAITTPPASVEDQVSGDEVSISVKRRIPPGTANFQVFVPANTQLSISNVIGKIDVRGLTGDVAVDAIDGDIRLVAVRAGSVDVKVTTGDITFDGDLTDGGSYSFQSVKGDIDVTLPAAASFDLNARSLSGVINLGDFVNSLTGGTKLRRGVSGTHLKSGTRLTMTAFSGRVLLHKKAS